MASSYIASEHLVKQVDKRALENLPLLPDTGLFQTEGIVGAVVFSGCVNDSASPWAMPECWLWIIKSAIKLPYTPVVGPCVEK